MPSVFLMTLYCGLKGDPMWKNVFLWGVLMWMYCLPSSSSMVMRFNPPVWMTFFVALPE